MMRPLSRLCVFLFLFGFSANGQTKSVLVEQYRFGDFTSAHAMEADGFGKIIVSDAGQHTISRFRLDGTRERQTGGQGWGNDQFDQPHGLDAHLGLAVYVADTKNNRIVRLDKDLNFTGSLSSQDGPSAQIAFGYPVDVVLSRLENLFILDGENKRILATSGFVLVEKTFGGIDAGKGALRSPVAMCQGSEEKLFVLEKDRVVVFDMFGNYLYEFGGGSILNGKGIAAKKNTIFVIESDFIRNFSEDGRVQGEWKKSDCVFAAPVDEFRDAAFLEDYMLLLTTKNVIVLQTN